tara:strand:+ start:23 stop:964 length:942 start_codon:yes stop_codon:yes gene_type:complete
MIKLGGLVTLKPITEADVYTATSKETGTTSVFKSKDARDAAIKAGTHEKRKDDKDGAVKDPTDKPKVNIFNKDKEEPKKDEPKDDGRPKDSTGGRAGNPQVNKEVRQKAKDLGVHPNNLGRKEYEKRMSQAAVQALTDSNFHSEARKLIAVLEDKPEWAKDPRQDPNKPDIMSPEYEKWQSTSVYSSDLYDSAPGTDEIAHEASQQAGWDGVSALDAIAFDLKVNGSKELALKIQNIIDDTNESTMRLNKMLPEGKPDRNLIRMAKAQNGNIKQDFEEMMDLLKAGENNDALNHIEDAISRLEDLHKVVKRKS